jgi:hypothetical protein
MLHALGEFLLEVTCGVTGHGLLRLLTLGRWRFRDDRHDLATLVGLLFWAGIVAVLVFAVGRP